MKRLMIVRALWISLLLVWVVLYLPHLRVSPGWYVDETCNVDVAQHWLNGVAAWEAIRFPFIFTGFQPIYTTLVAVGYALVGGDILGARLVNVLLALVIGLLLFGIGKRSLGHFPAWVAALTFLAYDQSIIHFRQAFHHNGLALGLTLALVMLLRRSSYRRHWLAGLGLVLGAGSHPLVYTGIGAAFLSRWRAWRVWIPLFLPAGIYLLLVLGIYQARYSQWLVPDLQWLMGSYRDSGEQANLAGNFFRFLTQDGFHLLTFTAALPLIFFKKLRPIFWFVFVPAILLLKNRSNLTVFYYQAVILLPALALSWGTAMMLCGKMLKKLNSRSPHARWGTAAFALLPLFYFVHSLPPSVSGSIKPRNHFWVTQSVDEVEAAAQWLNARVKPNDLVLSNTNLTWLLHCRTSTFLQSCMWSGKDTFGIPNGTQRVRFLYDVSLAKARYVAIGDLDWRWTRFQPNATSIFDQFSDTAVWRPVWQGETYLILENTQLRP